MQFLLYKMKVDSCERSMEKSLVIVVLKQLGSYKIDRKSNDNDFDNWLIISFIYQAKCPKILVTASQILVFPAFLCFKSQ